MTSREAKLAQIAELRDDFAAIETAARNPAPPSGTGSEPMSYGMDWFTQPEQTLKDINAGLQRVLGLLAPTATIQTASNGYTALSQIQYSSGVVSVFSNDLSLDLSMDHLDRVRQTFAFRNTVVGVVSAAGSAVIAISTANSFAIPGLLINLKDRIELLYQAVKEVD